VARSFFSLGVGGERAGLLLHALRGSRIVDGFRFRQNYQIGELSSEEKEIEYSLPVDVFHFRGSQSWQSRFI
jgi:hypothetical protein